MRIAAGTIIAQKYRLEAQVARGGMGSVWSARHVKLGQQLAIKFLDPKLAASPAFVARFEREARAAAAIQSPHVVQVHDFGVEENTPYIVMELLRGEDLRTRLRRVGRLSIPEAAGLLVQLGKALRRAHEAGIIHRDIKPGNLFLARDEDDEVLKVLDFGIAKQPDELVGESTRTGEIIGSPHYVSPEQGRSDKDVDHRTDVWAVGVILYRMLTGHLPFPGEGLGNVLAKILVEPPPSVRSFVATLPDSLDAFFALALAKKREERFQTVRELVDAFITLVRSELVEESIPPPSWSTIVSTVSKPPPPPAPPDAKRSSPAQAEPPPASAVEAGSAADQLAPSVVPYTSTGLDSLTPATSHGTDTAPPVVRFRWAIVAAVGLVVATWMAIVWSQGGTAQDASAGAAAGSPQAPTNSPEPISPPPPASPPAVTPKPPTSGTAIMTAKSASPTASAVPPSRSALVPPAPAAPASATGSKRNWGF